MKLIIESNWKKKFSLFKSTFLDKKLFMNVMRLAVYPQSLPNSLLTFRAEDYSATYSWRLNLTGTHDFAERRKWTVTYRLKQNTREEEMRDMFMYICSTLRLKSLFKRGICSSALLHFLSFYTKNKIYSSTRILE